MEIESEQTLIDNLFENIQRFIDNIHMGNTFGHKQLINANKLKKLQLGVLCSCSDWQFELLVSHNLNRQSASQFFLMWLKIFLRHRFKSFEKSSRIMLCSSVAYYVEIVSVGFCFFAFHIEASYLALVENLEIFQEHCLLLSSQHCFFGILT